jgi:hypothetical protein
LHAAASQDYADGVAGRAEFFMPGFFTPGLFTPRLLLMAATIALLSLPVGSAMAQSTPNTGAGTTAPAATAETPPTDAAKARKKRAAKKMTQQQEIDKSVDTGTVPARYRSSVPKEYHHLIPFDKR